MNTYTVAKIFFDKNLQKFCCYEYPPSEGMRSNKFHYIRSLFDHLVPLADNPSYKIIFDIPHMVADFRHYAKLVHKKKHFEALFNEYQNKLGGHTSFIDNKWNVYREDPNIHITVRRDRLAKRKISHTDSSLRQ